MEQNHGAQLAPKTQAWEIIGAAVLVFIIVPAAGVLLGLKLTGRL